MKGRWLSKVLRLRGQSGLAFAFILTLTLGVGGGTAFFAVLYGAALRPLPFAQPDELVLLRWQTTQGGANATTAQRFEQWRQHAEMFRSLGAFELRGSGVTVGVDESIWDYSSALTVSTSFFETLGLQPAAGRFFREEDGEPGAACVVVVSAGFWRQRLGAELRGLRLAARECKVVGVLPPDFRFEPSADLWFPLPRSAEGSDAGSRANVLAIVGRLAPQWTHEQASAAASSLHRVLTPESESWTATEVETVRLLDFADWLRGTSQRDLSLLIGAGVLVLGVCALNLLQLLLAWALARQSVTSLCRMLGASWGRIFRDLLAEMLVPAVVGAVGGVLLARGVVPALLAFGADSLPAVAEVRVGGLEVLFAAGCALALVVGTVALLVLRLSRRELPALQQLAAGGQISTARVAGRSLRRSVVVGQLTLAFAVLFTTFLLTSHLLALSRVDLGFETAEVWTFQAPRKGTASEVSTVRFSAEVVERLRQVPGISCAATASSLPLALGLNIPVQVQSADASLGEAVELRVVSADYFRCLGIEILEGRSLEPQDQSGAPPVAVVNQRFRERFFASAPALGQTLWLARGLGALSDSPREIVGLACDVRSSDLTAAPPAIVYVPQAQVNEALQVVIDGAFPLAFLMRSSSPVPREVLQETLAVADRRQALTAYQPLVSVVGRALDRPRLYALLAIFFGGLAAILTSLGIFGVTSVDVSQRRRELGIRLALGATRRGICRLVLGEVLQTSVVGCGLGAPLAFIAYRSVAALAVVGSPGGSALLAVVCLLSVSLAAALVPALRAASIVPLTALRAES